jgi:hypothetical protein
MKAFILLIVLSLVSCMGYDEQQKKEQNEKNIIYSEGFKRIRLVADHLDGPRTLRIYEIDGKEYIATDYDSFVPLTKEAK